MRLLKYDRLRQQLHEHEIRAEGCAEARAEIMNALLELMRANIISPEQLNAIKAAMLNS